MIDGQSLLPVFRDPDAEGRDHVFYYQSDQLYAVRMGPWKAHFTTVPKFFGEPEQHDPPLLYHLEEDPREKFNVAEEHPDVIEQIRSLAERHRENLTRGDPQSKATFDGPRLPHDRAPGVSSP